jgi:2-keto-3-deoxy-L-rhamnonate aldolase RhmA
MAAFFDAQTEQITNAFLNKLRGDQLVSSMTIRLVKDIQVCQIASIAGFDSIYIDLEHCNFSIETTSQLCISALQIGLMPFVRVPANTPEWISRVLDAGAMGIVAPHIRSAEEALAVVKYSKYPPYGERSSSGAMSHFSFKSIPSEKLYPLMNTNTVVIVQFESQSAIDNAESIISTQGVDIVLIGTNDLTADLGIPGQYDHPKVEATYQLTINLCKKYGKWCGVGGLSSRQDLVEKYVQMGARYVSTGTDLAFLAAIASEKAKQVKKITY